MKNNSISETWQSEGYILIRDAIEEPYLNAVRSIISERVDELAQQAYADGKLSSLHKDEPFGRRYAAMCEEMGQPSGGKMFTPGEMCAKPLYELYSHKAIQEVLEIIIGPEVTLHGISLFRTKLPDKSETHFPWHQDSQYYNTDRDAVINGQRVATEEMKVVTTWVPLVDTTLDNGCLWVIPGSHHWGFLESSRNNGPVRLSDEKELEKRGTPTPLPMKCGDVVFFTNLTIHGSKENLTQEVRWSHDFRLHASVDTSMPEPERIATGYFNDKSRRYGVEPLTVLSKQGIPSWEEWQQATAECQTNIRKEAIQK